MKILHVIPYFAPKRGGDVNVCYNLSKQLVKCGHEVIIITTDFEFDENYARTLEKKGIKVFSFHCIANIKFFLISPSMKNWLKKNLNYFDVIHLHDFRSYQNNIVHHYAEKYGIPYVLQAHGSVLPFFAKQTLKKLYDQIWGYRILKTASLVIALTKTEAEQYKKMGVDEDKIEIVPNGIDLSEYENLPDRGVFRRKYSIRNDEKIILYMGRLHRSKGIDLLILAFSDILIQLDNVRLVLVGPDDGNGLALKDLAQSLKLNNHILFTGFITNTEKMAALVDAEVFVTPSFYGFPVTFLEACACGTPIITTSGGDRLSWIHDNVGYVVEYNKDQLRDAIFMIMNDNKLKTRFGNEGKKIVETEFVWNRIVKNFEEIYEIIFKLKKA